MEGYFGNNNDFNYAFPPLNLSNDNTPPLASPRDCDLVPTPGVGRYDKSAMLRYLFSGSSSSDDNTTPRNRSSSVNQPHRLSRSSSGGSSSLRGSPLSSLENVEKFPRRIEEDVLVMDAIPVRSMARASGGSRSGRMKSPLSLSLDSAAKASPPMADYSCLHKREICRSWEDFGSCLYGPKCMFAHGKEEIDPRILTKPKSEMAHTKENVDPRIIRNPQSEFAYSKEEIDPRIITKLNFEMAHKRKNIDPRIIRKPKSEFVHRKEEEMDARIILKPNSEFSYGKENIDPRIIIRTAANLEVNMSKSPSIATPKYEQKNSSTEKVPTQSSSNPKQKEEEQNRESSSSSDLVDDGIEVRLPYAVMKALYEPSPLRKRLPVFEEICPSETT